MVNDMRLIDADALPVNMPAANRPSYFELLDAIEDAPTIDAVPVVRCKDCVYCEYRKMYLRCVRCGFVSGHEVEPDDFCSFGKREDGD